MCTSINSSIYTPTNTPPISPEKAVHRSRVDNINHLFPTFQQMFEAPVGVLNVQSVKYTPSATPPNTPPISPVKGDHRSRVYNITHLFPAFKPTFETPAGVLNAHSATHTPSTTPTNTPPITPEKAIHHNRSYDINHSLSIGCFDLDKAKHPAFFKPSLPKEAIPIITKGDYHDVWKHKIGDQTFYLKTIKTKKPNGRLYSLQEIDATIDKTIRGYDKFKDLKSPYFRMVLMINRDSCNEDGYYMYEFVKGREATAIDLKDYFFHLITDPLNYYIPDLRPDNVIVPSDKSLPVIIDPSSDDFSIDCLSYKDLEGSSQTHAYRWGSLFKSIVHQLHNWFPKEKHLNSLLEETETSSLNDQMKKNLERIKNNIH